MKEILLNLLLGIDLSLKRSLLVFPHKDHPPKIVWREVHQGSFTKNHLTDALHHVFFPLAFGDTTRRFQATSERH
jgi:hypothetical protein